MRVVSQLGCPELIPRSSPPARERARVSLGIQPVTRAGLPLPSLSRSQRQALDEIAKELRGRLLRLRAPYVASPKGRFIPIDSARPFVTVDLSAQLLVTVAPDGTVSGIGTEGAAHPAAFPASTVSSIRPPPFAGVPAGATVGTDTPSPSATRRP